MPFFRFQNLLKIALGAAVLAVFAQISFKIGPIPATGQSLAAILVGCVLGKKWGPLAVLFYLILGAAGLPVFAGGAAGFSVFEKPSAGFLLAFLPTTWLAAFLVEKGWSRTLAGCLGLFVVATFCLLAAGDAWLFRFFEAEKVWKIGLVDLLPGASLKAAIGAVLLRIFDRNLSRT